jgi:type II secretory pathway predicted ATPase ExeA
LAVEPITPDPQSHPAFIATAPALAALAQLEHGLGVRAPFVLLSGRDGMGKRTLARESLRRLSRRVTAATLSTPAPDAAAMGSALLVLFGGREQPGKSALAVLERLLEALANATSGGRVAVLVVPAAHTLATEQLNELKRLAVAAAKRQCPLEVWLVALPTLEQRLDEPELAEVREKVSARCRPTPLSPTDTRHYLQLRPNSAGSPSAGLFSRKACRDLHAATGGVPGAIETIATEAARGAARLSASTISPEHVRAAASAMRSGRIANGEFIASLPARREEKPAARQARPAPTFARTVTTPAAPAAPTKPSVPTESAARATAATPLAAATPLMPATRVVPAPHATTAIPVRPLTPGVPVRPAQPAPPANAPSIARLAPVPAAKPFAQPTPTPRPAPVASLQADFPPVSDPRVQDWIARFGGGSSVRVGTSYNRPLTAAELMDDVPCAGTTPGSSDDKSFWRPNALTPPPPPRPRGRPLGQRDARVPWTAIAAVMVVSVLALLYAQRGGLKLVPPLPAVAAAFRQGTPAERDTALMSAAEAVRARRAAKQAAAQAAERERFGVAVGTFLNPDMAHAEEEHLARLIPYKVWVSSSSVGGVRTYRLMLGTFDSLSTAESAAQSLLRRGLLRGATVVTLSADTSAH